MGHTAWLDCKTCDETSHHVDKGEDALALAWRVRVAVGNLAVELRKAAVKVRADEDSAVRVVPGYRFGAEGGDVLSWIARHETHEVDLVRDGDVVERLPR